MSTRYPSIQIFVNHLAKRITEFLAGFLYRHESNSSYIFCYPSNGFGETYKYTYLSSSELFRKKSIYFYGVSGTHNSQPTTQFNWIWWIPPAVGFEIDSLSTNIFHSCILIQTIQSIGSKIQLTLHPTAFCHLW